MQGIFPDSWKVAKVIPVFNRALAPYVTTIAPYQSFQPWVKFLKDAFLINWYFNTENILASNQLGVRAGKTTTDCLVDLVDDITKAIDEGSYAVSMFLDLSKVFDS